MVVSDRSALDFADSLVTEYDDAIVYGDVESETVLHEGSIRVLANGWVELPSGRLLSPSAVHHIDRKPAADR